MSIIPQNWLAKVAIKKASYFVAKLVVSGITAIGIANKIPGENLLSFEATVAAVIGGGLEILHDWAKLKWPDKKWL